MSVSKIASFLIPSIGVATGLSIGHSASFFRKIQNVNAESPYDSEAKKAIEQCGQRVGRIYAIIVVLAFRLVCPGSQPPPIWETAVGVVCIGFSFVVILDIKKIVHDKLNRAFFPGDTQKKLAEAVDQAFKFSILTAVVTTMLLVAANIRSLDQKV